MHEEHAPIPAGHRPARIQLSRKRGWRMPKGAVKVDRSTVYGNPFAVGGPNLLGWETVRDAEHAVWLHRQWLTTPSRSIAVELDRHDAVLRALAAGTLTGHDLACWCPTDARHCHGETLLELGNRPDIAQVAAALLDATAMPWTRTERAIALAQLARATGTPAGEVPRIGQTLREISDAIRAARKESTDA